MAAEKAAVPELYEPLLALKSRGWPGDIGDVEQAITACRPEDATDVFSWRVKWLETAEPRMPEAESIESARNRSLAPKSS